MKPIIVGEAPGRGRAGRPAAGKVPAAFGLGPSAGRLARLAGLGDSASLHRAFTVVNLVGQPVAGFRWPAEEARHVATVLSQSVDGGRFVLCGRRVAAAFGLRPGVPYFEWVRRPGFAAAVVPHPSGKNRWWNERRNLARAKRFFRSLAGRRQG